MARELFALLGYDGQAVEEALLDRSGPAQPEARGVPGLQHGLQRWFDLFQAAVDVVAHHLLGLLGVGGGLDCLIEGLGDPRR